MWYLVGSGRLDELGDDPSETHDARGERCQQPYGVKVIVPFADELTNAATSKHLEALTILNVGRDPTGYGLRRCFPCYS